MGCHKLKTGNWRFVSAETADVGESPFLFSSEYLDSKTNLVYYNYRYYSPELGRWTKRDSIGEDGGFNLYGMVGNDPVLWFDLLGLGRWEVKEDTAERIINRSKKSGKNISAFAQKRILDRGGFKVRYIKGSEECKCGEIVLEQLIKFKPQGEYRHDGNKGQRYRVEGLEKNQLEHGWKNKWDEKSNKFVPITHKRVNAMRDAAAGDEKWVAPPGDTQGKDSYSDIPTANAGRMYILAIAWCRYDCSDDYELSSCSFEFDLRARTVENIKDKGPTANAKSDDKKAYRHHKVLEMLY